MHHVPFGLYTFFALPLGYFIIFLGFPEPWYPLGMFIFGQTMATGALCFSIYLFNRRHVAEEKRMTLVSTVYLAALFVFAPTVVVGSVFVYFAFDNPLGLYIGYGIGFVYYFAVYRVALSLAKAHQDGSQPAPG